ncbi:MAG: dihydrodipicolinate synthase family protein [Thermodesulfobacteriota bacterium]
MPHPPSFPNPPPGLIIDLVTPLTAKGVLDGPGVDRLLARVLPAADGLIAGSPLAGEGLNLPGDLRRELYARMLAAVGGLVPLFFGITAATLEETRSLALWVRAEAQRQGYQGAIFLVDLPLWYHSNRGLPQSCQSLQAEAGLPLLLLNLPQAVRRLGVRFKHLNIRTQVFKKLAALPGVLGLIYQGEMRRFLHYHHAAGARPGFAFYETDEVRFLTRPGAWGVVSGGAQLLPGAWQRVTRACLHPEESADHPDHRYVLWDLGNRLQQVAQLSQGEAAALWKKIMAAQGVLSSSRVAPGTPPRSPEAAEKLLELLVEFAENTFNNGALR